MTDALFIKIIHCPTNEDPFCVVWKESGIPSAPLHERKTSALTLAASLCPNLNNVSPFKAEHGLIHRLDTDAKGLLLIAATDEAYLALTSSQEKGLFKKTYRAKVEHIIDNAALLGGFPPAHIGTKITSMFRPYGKGRKEVRPVTGESGKSAKKVCTKRIYTTAVESIEEGIATCSITAGFRHQVRCHLAWIGFPIEGDSLYNSHCSTSPLQFECIALSFPHPVTGKIVSINNFFKGNTL